MAGWLIYHPKREVFRKHDLVVYHDSASGNQDPYVWNSSFLHTACHMTQMSPRVGDINFWVSGENFPNFSVLLCDLVFVVERKRYWVEANHIRASEPLVETPEAFNDHYAWFPGQHSFVRRRRFTLKADPDSSFQPQDPEGNLIDLVPALAQVKIGLTMLRSGLRAGRGSKPMRLQLDQAKFLYDYLAERATVKLFGHALQEIRLENPSLASKDAPKFHDS